MNVMTHDRLEQRARDPVSRVLVRHLIVPWIYFAAPWAETGKTVDMLAVDRAGTGDVHVVEIKQRATLALRAIPSLLRVPAQFRWIAYFAGTATRDSELQLVNKECLYPPKGPGRVGVIEIVQMEGDELGANIRIKAERFPGSYLREVAKLVVDVEPDISFR